MRQCPFTQSFLKSINVSVFAFLLTFVILQSISVDSNAQATLSLQGILKKANGIALEDGEYPITFKMYVVDSTQVKWTETQPEVEVISGIYSVILGVVNPINLPFDKDYELGISIGSQEMRPRVRLTSAPYALALRGSTNQFPSSGQVLADEIKVAQGVVASGGAPGLNGVDKNGYAFTGNSGDNDSGLFSTSDAKVSLFVNNSEVLSITPGTATVNGNVNIINNGTVKYNGISDWRLVNVDDFNTNNTQGWASYPVLPGQGFGWNNPATGTTSIDDLGHFVGKVLRPSSDKDVLKKQFIIPGPAFTEIKVKFRYYFLGSWNNDFSDIAFAGFATNASGANFKIGWHQILNFLSLNGKFNNTTILPNLNFWVSDPYSDMWMDAEMTAAATNGNNFWVLIGAALIYNGGDDIENYAIGPVEIWVR